MSNSKEALALAENTWYICNESQTAIIFVHGILSNSKDCWTAVESTEDPIFWPDLIIKDTRIRTPSIFLGGYYTTLTAGSYDFSACAVELYAALQRPDFLNDPPMKKSQLIFVCHSMGGIIVRTMLVNNYHEFSAKKIGILLIGSPSYGSRIANFLRPLSSLAGHSQSRQLALNNDVLNILDDRFKDLLSKARINLCGAEAYEHRSLWSLPLYVVNKNSAGRYFSAPRLLRNTNHSTCVKPTNYKHPAYEFLFDFLMDKFPELIISPEEILLRALSMCAREVLLKICTRQLTLHVDREFDYLEYQSWGVRGFGRWTDNEVRAAIDALVTADLIADKSDERWIRYETTPRGKLIVRFMQDQKIKETIGDRPKTYLYISNTKLDMLAMQYQNDTLKSLSTDNVFRKISVVEQLMRDDGIVGSIDSPDEYFWGEVEMRWGPYGRLGLQQVSPIPKLEPLVYFGGAAGDTEIALCGSTKHLLGFDLGFEPSLGATSYSVTPTIEVWLRRQLQLAIHPETEIEYDQNKIAGIVDDRKTIHAAILRYNSTMYGTSARLEFLAKTLLHIIPRPEDVGPLVPNPLRTVLLGSPLYVALWPPTRERGRESKRRVIA